MDVSKGPKRKSNQQAITEDLHTALATDTMSNQQIAIEKTHSPQSPASFHPPPRTLPEIFSC
jgi:hypothetical protein